MVEVKEVKKDCNHPVVAIHWIDAETTKEAWSVHKRKEPQIMVTIGFEVDRDENFIYHASTHCTKKVWGDLGKIPLGMVKRVDVISANRKCRG